MEFISWLETEKQLSKRSARDVQSRLARVINMTKVKEVNIESIKQLEKDEEFQKLSISVKSQLRRSIRLYDEYKEINNK